MNTRMSYIAPAAPAAHIGFRVNATPDRDRAIGYKCYPIPALATGGIEPALDYDTYGTVYDANSRGAAFVRSDCF